jgi:hypothetical protein
VATDELSAPTKLVVDLSKPEGHPDREQMIPLTAEEIAERRGDPSARIGSFVGAARSPDNWGVLAERLRLAADVVLREKQSAPIIEEDFRQSPSFWLGAVHMMLLGQSVEVATKGLLVAQDPAWVEEDQPQSPFRWRKRGHDIPYLLRKAGIALSSDQERVADLLRDFVQWGGRYPTPVNLQSAHPLEWTGEDVVSAEALYDQLEQARRSLLIGD